MRCPCLRPSRPHVGRVVMMYWRHTLPWHPTKTTLPVAGASSVSSEATLPLRRRLCRSTSLLDRSEREGEQEIAKHPSGCVQSFFLPSDLSLFFHPAPLSLPFRPNPLLVLSYRRAAQLVLGRTQVHRHGIFAREDMGGGWRPSPAHGRGTREARALVPGEVGRAEKCLRRFLFPCWGFG